MPKISFNTKKNDVIFVERKAVICGNVVDIYEYESPYKKGGVGSNKTGRRSENVSDDDKANNRTKTLMRARQEVRRLANANYDVLTKFFTLTFENNVRDLDFANNEFNKFIKRLNRYLAKIRKPKVEYIAVPEFQKRGAVHYHLLCNLPYISANKLAEIWGLGFVKINKIDEVDNVGAYVSKYMSKDNDDTRLVGRRSYFVSQGLKRPVELYNNEVLESEIVNCLVAHKEYSAVFHNDCCGVINYKQLTFPKYVDLKESSAGDFDLYYSLFKMRNTTNGNN